MTEQRALQPGARVQLIGGAWTNEIGKLATVLSLTESGQVARVVVDGERGTLLIGVANLREWVGQGPLWDACVQREIELRDAARRYERSAWEHAESRQMLDAAAVAFAQAERVYLKGDR